MYDELIAELRQHHCDANEADTQEVCDECAYDVIIVDKSAPSGFASVCVCGLMNRAADAIEELSKTKWIPVTEELPEKRCNFYIVADFGDVREAYYNSDGVWFSQGNKLKGVTHWMPLPQPPTL